MLTYAGVFVLVLFGGASRLTFKRSKAKAKRMAAIGWPTHILRIDELSGSLNPEMSSDERSYYTWKFRQIQDWFLENSGREAQAGAKVIVWPENNLMVYEPDYAVFMGRAKALARREGVYLLMGIACILFGETRPFEP